MKVFFLSSELEELIKLWAECCREANLWKFRHLDTCYDCLRVREKLRELNSYHREFFGTGVEYIPEVRASDERLLRSVLVNGVAQWKEILFSSAWWWHLHLVAKRLYPAQFLYDYPYLREIYLESFQELIDLIPQKSNSELISEWELYTAEDDFCYLPAYHHRQAFYYLSVRDEIERRGLSQTSQVLEADRELILGVVLDSKIYRHGLNKDLTQWWWHLDKINQRTYPAHLLPEPLRETYLFEHLLIEWERVVSDESILNAMCTNDYDSVYLLTREEIHKLSLDEHTRVIEADKVLIRHAMKIPCVEPDDPEEQPLHKWWWHLHKFHDRTYPVELLPEPLRHIYLGKA